MPKQITRKLERFIREKDIEAEHMLRTSFWLREIYPEADEAFCIAAICHDIERLFPLRERELKPPKTLNDNESQEYLVWHGKRSAEFTEKLLREYGFDNEKELERIKTIISEHSFGGTKEKDFMRDADSISFLENNADMFIEKCQDKKALREKFDSEYNRLSSEKARGFAKLFYEEAIKKLEKL